MTTTTPVEEDGVKRRDFLYIAAGGLGAVGTAAAIWPFVSQMNPSADVLALSTTEVDLEGIETGSEVTVVWQVWFEQRVGLWDLSSKRLLFGLLELGRQENLR